VVGAGSGGGVGGELGVGGGVPADAGQGEVADDQRVGGVLVVVVVLVVAVSPFGLLGASPGAPVCAQGLVGGGVAAGFGGEVPAVAEHVGPAPQASPGVVPVGLLLVAGPAGGAGAELVGVGDEPAAQDWADARAEAGLTTSNHEDMHAGEAETSILLHRYPDVVRPGYDTTDHLADDRRHLLTEGVHSYAPEGVIGRPSLASADKGRRLLDAFSGLFKLHLVGLRQAQ
jgi:Creatinine amidohydrolase